MRWGRYATMDDWEPGRILVQRGMIAYDWMIAGLAMEFERLETAAEKTSKPIISLNQSLDPNVPRIPRSSEEFRPVIPRKPVF